MKEIRTEVDIDAPPAKVWEVLSDFRSHASWNPFIKTMSGKANLGERLALTIRTPDGNTMRFTPEVTASDPGRELRWVGKLWLSFIMEGEHYFILEANGKGSTHLIHGENFSGLLPMVMGEKWLRQTEAGFKMMNRALKGRAEAG